MIYRSARDHEPEARPGGLWPGAASTLGLHSQLLSTDPGDLQLSLLYCSQCRRASPVILHLYLGNDFERTPLNDYKLPSWTALEGKWFILLNQLYLFGILTLYQLQRL